MWINNQELVTHMIEWQCLKENKFFINQVNFSNIRSFIIAQLCCSVNSEVKETK